MEKANDTMTICTLTQPGTVTISAAEYKEIVKTKAQYEALVEMISQSLTLAPTMNGGTEVVVDFEMRKVIPMVFKMIEPVEYKWRLKQLQANEEEKA